MTSSNSNILLLSREQTLSEQNPTVFSTVKKSVILSPLTKPQQDKITLKRDSSTSAEGLKSTIRVKSSIELNKLGDSDKKSPPKKIKLQPVSSGPINLSLKQTTEKLNDVKLKFGLNKNTTVTLLPKVTKTPPTRSESGTNKVSLSPRNNKLLLPRKFDQKVVTLSQKARTLDSTFTPKPQVEIKSEFVEADSKDNLERQPKVPKTVRITSISTLKVKKEVVDDDIEEKDPLALDETDEKEEVDIKPSQDVIQPRKSIKLTYPKTKPILNKDDERRLGQLLLTELSEKKKIKEKCEFCGVGFINLKAHQEKYHYMIDVDKCNLCGKVCIIKYPS